MDRTVSLGNLKCASGMVLVHQPVICQGTRRSERNGFQFLSSHRALAGVGTSPAFHLLLVDAPGPKVLKAKELPHSRNPAGSAASCFPACWVSCLVVGISPPWFSKVEIEL